MWSSITTYASARSGMTNMKSTYHSIIGSQSADGQKDAKNGAKWRRPYVISPKPSPSAAVQDPCSPGPGMQGERNIPPGNARGSPTTPSFKGGKDVGSPNNEPRRTASQNFLRAKLIDIGRRSGMHGGLNVAIGCKNQEFSGNPENCEPDIVGRGSGPVSYAGSLKSESSSSTSLFQMEETSSFEFYAEDNDPSPSTSSVGSASATNKSKIETSGSVIAVYSNPKYGKGQRAGSRKFQQQEDDLDQTLTLQDSTEVLLSPFISDSALSLGQEESEIFFEALDKMEEEYEIPDPSVAAREYNRLLSSSRPQGENTYGTKDSDPLALDPSRERVLVTNIPCDSWVALPLRILPGHVVPEGFVILLPPLLLTFCTALALIFL